MTEVLAGDPKSREFGLALAELVAQAAAGRVHKLQSFQVDGKHPLTSAAANSILRYLGRCPLRDETEENVGRARTQADVQALRQVTAESTVSARLSFSDIPGGFYATPNKTDGSNDFSFWKVTEGRKPGYRFVKRVVGGGSGMLPELLEVGHQQQVGALRAILDKGITESAALYSELETRCTACGRQLTDETSRAYGKGPKCREKE
jgi:hypothetical protein